MWMMDEFKSAFLDGSHCHCGLVRLSIFATSAGLQLPKTDTYPKQRLLTLIVLYNHSSVELHETCITKPLLNIITEPSQANGRNLMISQGDVSLKASMCFEL